MKIASVILFLLSLSVHFVSAQPTKAEIDKMLKQSQELMKKYGNDSTVNKAMKDGMKNQQGSSNGSTNNLYNSDPGAYGNVDNWKFPTKNPTLLASLPKKVFTKAELVGYLNSTYSELSKKLPQSIHSSVQSIAAKFKNDANKMGDAAVTGWYTDYREEALLLIIKASGNNPDNGLLLNNCAALLNMSGIEHKAIPILKYILQSYPGSSMVLNNLGQAFAGLGETDTAMFYLGRCMEIEPEHPEACNTAGQIEAAKGNKEKAVAYLEKSIKSAYTKTAELKLRKINKGSKISRLVRPRVKLPEYFNFFKYQVPAQCTRVEDAAVAQAEHNAFREMITKQGQMYGGKWADLTQKKTQEGMQIMRSNGTGRVLRKDEFMAQPYYELSGIMARDVLSEFQDALKDLSTRVYKKYESEMELLENGYQATLKKISADFAQRSKDCCGDGKPIACCPSDEEKCNAYNNLANQYLPKFAALTEDWQQKNMLVYNQYFDELVYWHYLALHATGEDNFRMRYYEFIMKYLAMMGSIGQTKIIKPCKFTPTTATSESNTIKEMDCPVDVELGFGVGKIQLNCEKFSFTAGEGVILGYEKDFKTKQSTLSVGIGVKLDLGVKVGPVKAIVGVKATESAFITFDGRNGIADFGMENEAKLIGHVTGVVKEDVSIGSKFGIHSGYDFNPGPLKGLLESKPESPLNKNVPIYKPKQG